MEHNTVSAEGFHVKETSFPGIKKRERFPFQHQHDRTAHARFITDTKSHFKNSQMCSKFVKKCTQSDVNYTHSCGHYLFLMVEISF